MLQKITTTGCSVTALIVAFVAIDSTHAFEATATRGVQKYPVLKTRSG